MKNYFSFFLCLAFSALFFFDSPFIFKVHTVLADAKCDPTSAHQMMKRCLNDVAKNVNNRCSKSGKTLKSQLDVIGPVQIAPIEK